MFLKNCKEVLSAKSFIFNVNRVMSLLEVTLPLHNCRRTPFRVIVFCVLVCVSECVCVYSASKSCLQEMGSRNGPESSGGRSFPETDVDV